MKVLSLTIFFSLSFPLFATTLIDKSMWTNQDSIQQYIQNSNPYQTIQDDFIVVNMETGSSEKYSVSHHYNGEFVTAIYQTPMTANEKSAVRNGVNAVTNVITNAPENTWLIPNILGVTPYSVNTQTVGQYSFSRVDLTNYISAKINLLLSDSISSFVGVADNIDVRIATPKFRLADGGTVKVEITYNRYDTKTKIIELVDKYGNNIPLTSDDLKNTDYKLPEGSDGYFSILIKFLNDMGNSIDWSKWPGGAASFDIPAGNTVIIDCKDGVCQPDQRPKPQ